MKTELKGQTIRKRRGLFFSMPEKRKKFNERRKRKRKRRKREKRRWRLTKRAWTRTHLMVNEPEIDFFAFFLSSCFTFRHTRWTRKKAIFTSANTTIELHSILCWIIEVFFPFPFPFFPCFFSSSSSSCFYFGSFSLSLLYQIKFLSILLIQDVLLRRKGKRGREVLWENDHKEGNKK